MATYRDRYGNTVTAPMAPPARPSAVDDEVDKALADILGEGGGGNGGGDGGGGNSDPGGGGGASPVLGPNGELIAWSVPGAPVRQFDLTTGEYVMVPGKPSLRSATVQEKRAWAAGASGTAGGLGGGGGARGRTVFPWERDAAELQNELRRKQIETFGQDREDALRKFDLQFGSSEEQRGIDNAYRNAQFAWQQAVKAQDFEEARRQFDLMQGLRVRAADLQDRQFGLDEQKFGLQSELGYADSRRADVRTNLDRAGAFGYTLDDSLGVAAGTQTAAEKQRLFGNTLALGDRRQQQANLEDERRQRGLELANTLALRQTEQQRAAAQDEEQKRRFDVQTMIAGRRQAAPQVTVVAGMGGRRF